MSSWPASRDELSGHRIAGQPIPVFFSTLLGGGERPLVESEGKEVMECRG